MDQQKDDDDEIGIENDKFDIQCKEEFKNEFDRNSQIIQESVIRESNSKSVIK